MQNPDGSTVQMTNKDVEVEKVIHLKAPSRQYNNEDMVIEDFSLSKEEALERPPQQYIESIASEVQADTNRLLN